MKTIQRERPATGREVEELLGQADADLVADILHSGATCSDIREAKAWLDDDDYIGATLKKPMHERVRRVYNILLEEREKNEE